MRNHKSKSLAFLKHATVNGNTINGYLFHAGKTDAPILKDALSFIECKIDEIIEGTDHDVVIASVINAGIQSEGSPLILRSTGWSYGG